MVVGHLNGIAKHRVGNAKCSTCGRGAINECEVGIGRISEGHIVGARQYMDVRDGRVYADLPTESRIGAADIAQPTGICRRHRQRFIVGVEHGAKRLKNR